MVCLFLMLSLALGISASILLGINFIFNGIYLGVLLFGTVFIFPAFTSIIDWLYKNMGVRDD